MDLILVESESETLVLQTQKTFLHHEVDAYIKNFKARYPDRFVQVTRMTKAEYDKINKELEENF
ncbi:hypothetical protein [Adhaeribacter radiodurans]|uniref:Uncharacterized protein n=1 Tax=Adhaeribacter radiodurans TaxID=2745197 RepID=A0A7L7L6Z4_9BACT|nr:hypothetical protein [Adhaeribacter radiodurans]QMU28119.1 hypothetical protein HUW48_08695 [Adhaeribacter radiodurans]